MSNDSGQPPHVDDLPPPALPSPPVHPSTISTATVLQNDQERQILDRIKKGELWMILLTAVVALTTFVQAVQSCNNNRSTSRQVDRVIGVATDIDKASDHISIAADHIGDAGNRFAGSAATISSGVSNAVTKLQAQANEMSASRQSADKNAASTLQATIDSFHDQQRAWIGIAETKPLVYQADDPKAPANLTVAFTIKNYGHSAAEHVRFLAELVSDPMVNAISCDELSKVRGGNDLLPTQELTINWVMSLTRAQMAQGWQHQNPVLGNDLILKVLVCIDYSDKAGEVHPHRTQFPYILASKRAYITGDTKQVPGADLDLAPMVSDSGQTR